MRKNLKNLIEAISIKPFLFITLLSFVIINFIVSLSFKYEQIKLILNNYFYSLFLIFLCITFLLIFLIILAFSFRKENKTSLNYSSIALSPIILLLFWDNQNTSLSFIFPIVIVLLTQIIFFMILSKEKFIKINTQNQKRFIFILAVLYFSVFTYISIQRFNSLCFFNPKDFAIYNQTFWNTIQGKFFQNSTYGSNFACHNSPFYLFLVPFYYLFPHPLTLSILKTLFLSLSIVSFYLIVKDILKDNSFLPLISAYLLYPFLVSQNFTPPHEICFLPFFLLFTYYFFRKDRFLPFLIFLILSLSVKENLSLVALMFGFYSLFCKKTLKWILAPLSSGIIWGIFSLFIILHFQKIYQANPDSAWFFVVLKNRYLSGGNNLLSSVTKGLSSSNLANSYGIRMVLLLFFPLGIILPLLSPISLVGLPEFVINLLSDRSANFSPFLHYNIIVSCFLLIGTTEGIEKISKFRLIKKMSLRKETLKMLISIFILSSTIIYSYSWIGILKCKNDKAYIKTAKEALSYIPKRASVTAPLNLVVYISGRNKYSLLEDKEYGDYILIDKKNFLLLDKKVSKNYRKIFNKEGIVILKKLR